MHGEGRTAIARYAEDFTNGFGGLRHFGSITSCRTQRLLENVTKLARRQLRVLVRVEDTAVVRVHMHYVSARP